MKGCNLMILPKKHISLYESLFGYGAFLLELIKEPTTMELLWKRYQDAYKQKNYSVKFTFDQFIVTIDYLFMINAISFDERGMITHEVNKIESK